MALDQRRLMFGFHYLKDVPQVPGVYVLWNGDEPQVVGSAPELRDVLMAEYLEVEYYNRTRATHFSYEQTLAPSKRADDLTREFSDQGKSIVQHQAKPWSKA